MKELKKKKIRGNWSNVSMIEGWLSDMAKQGFALKEINETKATFEETRSEDVVYRIKYLPDNKDIEDVNMNRDEIYAQICSQGWEYICAYGYYLVFKATDNTNYNELPVYDFEIKKNLKENKKQILNYSGRVLLVVFSFYLSLFGFSTHIEMDIIIMKGGFLYFCALIVIILMMIAAGIKLFTFRRKIKLKKIQSINWKKEQRKNWAILSLYICAILIFMSSIVIVTLSPRQAYALDEIPDDTIRLLEIEDLGDSINSGIRSTYESESSFLVPYQYHLNESYYGHDPSIEIDYYKLRFKFLAKSLVLDIKKYWYNDVYEIESEYFDFVETSETYHDSLYIVIISDDIVLSIEYSGDKTAEEILYTVEKKLKQSDKQTHKENHSLRCGSLRLFG